MTACTAVGQQGHYFAEKYSANVNTRLMMKLTNANLRWSEFIKVRIFLDGYDHSSSVCFKQLLAWFTCLF